MAIIYQTTAFDQTQINLNALYSGITETVMKSGINYPFMTYVWPDVFGLKSTVGSNLFIAAIAGQNLTTDATRQLTGGTVLGFLAGVTNAPEPDFGWIDIAVDAVPFWAAFASATGDDDVAMFNATLTGDDSFRLSAYDDIASGLTGNDTMAGLGGRDLLSGGDGADVLNGSAGNDRLIGGAGKDRMTGAGGADAFIFTAATDTTNLLKTCDQIADFVHGTDKINLAQIDASTLDASQNAFVWRGMNAFTTSTAGEVRYQVYDNTGTADDYTLIYFDRDNDTAAEFILKLVGLHVLSAADFAL